MYLMLIFKHRTPGCCKMRHNTLLQEKRLHCCAWQNYCLNGHNICEYWIDVHEMTRSVLYVAILELHIIHLSSGCTLGRSTDDIMFEDRLQKLLESVLSKATKGRCRGHWCCKQFGNIPWCGQKTHVATLCIFCLLPNNLSTSAAEQLHEFDLMDDVI